MVKLTDRQLLAVAVAGLALAWYAKTRLTAVAKAAAPLVNPFDERNLAYTSTNSLLGAISGVKDFSLGTAIYDVTHNGSLNPTSDNNLIYRGVNAVNGFSLGTKIYDVTHDGSLNPASTNNVIYRQVGGPDWSIGTKIYDWLN